MPVKEKIFLSSDNAQKLGEAITEHKTVVLHFTAPELAANELNQNGTLTTLLLMPQQARALRAARADGADLQLSMTPGMVKMQTGGGIWDMIKGAAGSALKGAAQGALQGVINHVTGGPAPASEEGEGIRMVPVKLSDHQKRRVKSAMEKHEKVTLKLDKDSIHGHSEKLPLTGRQHQRLKAAKDGKRGLQVTIEHKHLVEHGGDMGDIFKNIIGIGSQLLPMLL